MIKTVFSKQFILFGICFLFADSIAVTSRSAAQPVPIDLPSLQNTTYLVPNYGQVILTNGKFQSTGEKIIAVQLSQDALIGNFDKDQYADGIAVLKVTSPNQRPKYYLALVVNHDGTPINTDTVFLGEGVIVDKVATQNGTITANMRKYFPGDPPCCPSGLVTQQYSINPIDARLVITNDNLTQPSGVDVQNVPAPPIGIGGNIPYQPPTGEIRVRF
jgi:hypothetical protein